MCDKVNGENLLSINSFCSLLEVAGNNADIFLNNLLISDLSSLSDDKFHYTALCNSKGRIVSSLWIKVGNRDQIYLVCPSNMLDYLRNFFNMRKFRLKLHITEVNMLILISSNNLTIDSNSQDIKNATIVDFYQFMFSQNLPWIDKYFAEKFIPQHVNLDQHANIMSFSKGCYPGQEIIARIKYLGKIKKRMHLLVNNSENQLTNEAKGLQAVSKIVFDKSLNQYSVQVIKNGV
ncbi:MAG: hypothetical protein L3J53_04315 [Proteobacteria bacterium]|nr:hypothetical protein [Pseudomonadota bacterium]